MVSLHLRLDAMAALRRGPRASKPTPFSKNVPQGPKALVRPAHYGTAEAVPFVQQVSAACKAVPFIQNRRFGLR
jgi:hypothetical protein